MGRGRVAVPIAERLATRLVAANDGCLLWSGPTGHNGYGSLGSEPPARRLLRAHRVAYEIANGPIPEGLQVDHLCRNRRCCNPEHLELVTREENIRRGNAPHMINARKTHCAHGHEYTPENTLIYRISHHRYCRQCEIIKQAQRRAERASRRDEKDHTQEGRRS